MAFADRFAACQALPPCPNWYTSNCCATNNALFVYATKSLIVVLDLDTFAFRYAFDAAIDKIQAIELHDHFLFTSGVEPIVRVWNLRDASFLISYSDHSVEVTVIRCIRDGSVVISGDKSGTIVVRESFGPSCKTFNEITAEVRAIAPISYMGEDYVAVGYVNGMILVLHIDKELKITARYRLLTGNDAIHSLAWQRVSQETTEWPLLASSTRRAKTIHVWTVPSESSYCKFDLPKPSTYWSEQQRSTTWTELNWSPIVASQIYLTSYIGLVLCFDIKNPRKPSLVANQGLQECHSRVAFSLLWAHRGNVAVTSSLDKQLIKWNLRTRKPAVIVKTQQKVPRCITVSPHNTGQAAVGYDDGQIRLWTFSLEGSALAGRKKKNFYDSVELWKGLTGNIEQVMWHPEKDGIMVYSNSYGNMGLYDVYNSKAIPFKGYHKQGNKQGGAPLLAWASSIPSVAETMASPWMMISYGVDDKMFVHDAENPSRRPVELIPYLQEKNPVWYESLLLNPERKRRRLATDDKSQYLAVGYTDGLVEIYRLDTLKIIFVSNALQGQISAMHWRYIRSTLYLAVGDTAGAVVVHSMATVDVNTDADIPVPTTTVHSTLSGHKGTITVLQWSAHQDTSYLASASADNLVYVWDIDKACRIAAFRNHRGNVQSLCWQLLDKDKLFSGANDRFIYSWKYTDYPYREEDDGQPLLYMQERRILAKAKSAAKGKALNPKSVNPSESPEKRKLATTDHPEPTKKAKGGPTVRLLRMTDAGIDSVNRLARQKQTVQLAATAYGGDLTKVIASLKHRLRTPDEKTDAYTAWSEEDSFEHLILGSKNDVRELVDREVKHLESQQKSTASVSSTQTTPFGGDMAIALEMMRSNFGQLASKNEGATSPSLYDWVSLALSPIGGKTLWLECMEKQAKRLAATGQVHLAVACYLACSKVYDAVEVYRGVSMFREAIALAKLRLPTKDPMLGTLFAEWAGSLERRDNLELAAQCYIETRLPGAMLNAINLLARRETESAFFWSACLARLVNDSTAEERISQWLDAVNKRQQTKASSTDQVPNDSADEQSK